MVQDSLLNVKKLNGGIKMAKEKVTISVRIDKDVKEQFEVICKSIGLNVSDAISVFARKVVSEEAIPFEVKLKK